ncbi:hypothetical protein N7520_001106 [Penicillium odoratum]|uniref:uncharacterized protein n=1 Tax=Penicillium odoratum TaxID=1167516 RepID=UPI002549199C|nr:uncharacterized protein N7520_001106 [Penicillium odoratum]KAJ5777860.1 hypothetical protein N7520_001106 [Penicillium odoratum]
MRNSPDMANGGSHPNSNGARNTLDGQLDSTGDPDIGDYAEDQGYKPGEQGGSKPPRSKSKAQGPTGGSFSARAHDSDLGYTTRKPVPDTTTSFSDESNTPRGLHPTSNLSETEVTSQKNQEPATSKGPTDPNPQSPPSRSNTMRSTSSPRRDWAPDRSPLQKLEVTLNGISKEEKRARVQEAEMRLRERLARQKVEREQAEAAAKMLATAKAAATAAPRPTSKQSSQSENRPSSSATRERERKGVILEDPTRDALLNQQQPRGAPVRHNRNIPTIPQYPVRPDDAQYVHAEAAIPQNAKMGQVPRRSVTVSGPAAKPAPPGENMRHTRSVSGQGAPKQRIFVVPGAAPVAIATAPAMFSEDTVEKPLAAQAAQKSVHSLPKPRKQTVSFNVPPPTPPPIFDWKTAVTGRLQVTDFDFQHLDMNKSKAWWEGGGTEDRRKSRALPKNYQTPAQMLTGVTQHKNFEPRLFLQCGPLLRYTGIKKVNVTGPQGTIGKEIWRGSILIVTRDSRSSYQSPPTLRLFSQPMNLLPPPPAEISREDGVQLAPEYIDPTAGLMKIGRDGRPLYVKPVDHLEEEVDLSAVENDDGIYEMSPSNIDYKFEESGQPIPANRMHPVDGETAGLHRDIPGARLYADPARDVTFWRFNLEVELGTTQQRIAYRINQGPAIGFWVPAAGKPMNIVFHSGNGFSPSVDSSSFCGPDPLWRDILNEHQTQPFHVMIGGGDQIFNDGVTTDSHFFQEWTKIKNPAERYSMPFTPEFRAELEQFYLQRYAAWFSQGLFSLANSQIPMVNIWNDHEILEGYGSYNEEFMQSMVISGLGRIAYKYYLLFQHHSVPDETEADEPSWILGAHNGPYIEQKSRNLFMSLGGDVVLLGLDCRTERTSTGVLSEETNELIWDRCHQEVARGETKHMIVLCSVPVAYPRVAMLKNFMNSRKSLGKSGKLGGLVSRSGGNVEVFDDHWAGKQLKAERTWLVEDLQDFAAEKSIRVTILSGDVHLAAIGQFYSNPKLNIPKNEDYRYMPNVISSAIADIPETELISDMLNKRNTVHHIDSNTDEDIIPIFTQDVDGKSRNNKRLLPRRNWCSIREYRPGLTPAGTPDSSMTPTPEPRPNKLQRTLSLGRGDRAQETGPSKAGGLFRRLSGRGPPPTRAMSFGREGGMPIRRASVDSTAISRPTESGDSYFPGAPQEPQPGRFLRRPTNLSDKGARKAKHGDDGVGAFVDLEGGLAITLNMEVSPQDPAGITIPYKLLVPALRYEGDGDDPLPKPVAKGWRKWLNMPRRKKNPATAGDDDGEEDEEEEVDDYEDHDTVNNTRANAAIAQQHYYERYSGSDDSESEVPQRLPAVTLTDSSPEEEYPEEEYEDEPVSRRKKWFGRK